MSIMTSMTRVGIKMHGQGVQGAGRMTTLIMKLSTGYQVGSSAVCTRCIGGHESFMHFFQNPTLNQVTCFVTPPLRKEQHKRFRVKYGNRRWRDDSKPSRPLLGVHMPNAQMLDTTWTRSCLFASVGSWPHQQYVCCVPRLAVSSLARVQ